MSSILQNFGTFKCPKYAAFSETGATRKMRITWMIGSMRTSAQQASGIKRCLEKRLRDVRCPTPGECLEVHKNSLVLIFGPHFIPKIFGSFVLTLGQWSNQQLRYVGSFCFVLDRRRGRGRHVATSATSVSKMIPSQASPKQKTLQGPT